jgi:hypothetical protein
MVVGVLVLGLIDQRLLQDLWIYGSFVVRASSNVIVVIVRGGPCDMLKRRNMRDAVIKRLSMHAQGGFRWRSIERCCGCGRLEAAKTQCSSAPS